MKNIFYLFILIILIFSCKKTTTETDNNLQEISQPNDDLNKLIYDLGGNTSKKKIMALNSTFSDLNNNSHKISDFKGKVVFLNLWATWCPPCRAEMPSMSNLFNNFKDKNFVILAVSQGESVDTVKSFLKKNSFSFEVYVDSKNEIATSYSTNSIPTTYLIDKEGYIVAQFVGGREWDSKESNELINKLL